MEINNLTNLTTFDLPALERLVRERQGWSIFRSDSHSCRLSTRAKVDAIGFNAQMHWYKTDEEAWAHIPPLTADEYLTLLDGSPLRVALGCMSSKNLNIETGDTLSQALKRAILIAYLDNPTGTNESQTTKEA